MPRRCKSSMPRLAEASLPSLKTGAWCATRSFRTSRIASISPTRALRKDRFLAYSFRTLTNQEGRQSRGQPVTERVAIVSEGRIAPPLSWPHRRRLSYALPAANDLGNNWAAAQAASQRPSHRGELGNPRAEPQKLDRVIARPQSHDPDKPFRRPLSSLRPLRRRDIGAVPAPVASHPR
jgi:hypothetical protein